jgi:hypothetical protein
MMNPADKILVLNSAQVRAAIAAVEKCQLATEDAVSALADAIYEGIFLSRQEKPITVVHPTDGQPEAVATEEKVKAAISAANDGYTAGYETGYHAGKLDAACTEIIEVLDKQPK